MIARNATSGQYERSVPDRMNCCIICQTHALAPRGERWQLVRMEVLYRYDDLRAELADRLMRLARKIGSM